MGDFRRFLDHVAHCEKCGLQYCALGRRYLEAARRRKWADKKKEHKQQTP